MVASRDLDQGGGIPQVVRTYLGPSVGYKQTDSPVDIEYVISGGGGLAAPGYQGALLIPDWLTIYGWTLLGDRSGSCVVDVWKTTKDLYIAGHVPTVADTITGSSKPTVTAAVAAESNTLTGWTTQINQNDVLAFNLDSVSSFFLITVILRCIRNIGPS